MRARITQTVTVEFELRPECYPEDSSTLDMIGIDMKYMQDDPTLILRIGDVDPVIKLSGEVLP